MITTRQWRGKPAATIPSQRGACLGGVPVLMYHGVAGSNPLEIPAREGRYWLTAETFREQLDVVRRLGFHASLLEDLRSASEREAQTSAFEVRGSSLTQGTHLTLEKAADLNSAGPRYSVVFTFDDGLASAYEVAYPLLLRAGARANFFVNTTTIGRPGFLSWGQIEEMQRAGMSFQSHSHEHVYLTWLAGGALGQQLRRSKQTLEERLGQPVHFLAAPYGDLNGRVVRVAEQEGYQAVCGSWCWPARPGSRVVNRVAIDGHTTLGDLTRLLTGDLTWYAVRALRGSLIYVPKRLLLPFWPSPPPQSPKVGAQGRAPLPSVRAK